MNPKTKAIEIKLNLNYAIWQNFTKPLFTFCPPGPELLANFTLNLSTNKKQAIV